ncbi:MAG: alpha/beta hydrolase [Chitinophagales bacterium]|nr:alpha/beta hydrolase [Chitinophagales bacterium]
MKSKLLYIIIPILLLISCKKESNGSLDNYYFLSIDNVALPVRVTGNPNSDIAIVFVHGGPGGSAQTERNFLYWELMEKNYKCVFYDQRGASASQGNAKDEDFTIEKFAEDLDVVVDFTKSELQAKSVFVHGVSWGGGLATYYCLDTTHQNKINGLIAEAPAYDTKNGMALSVNFILNFADSMIANNTNAIFWENLKNYYALNPTITNENFRKHLEYMGYTNGVIYNPLTLIGRNTSIPDVNLDEAYKNEIASAIKLKYNNEPIFKMDLTPFLSQIDIPVLLIWGAKDGLLPKDNLASKYAIAVGTPYIHYNPNKYLEAAHLPHAEDYLQFQSDAIDFIETYK